MQMDLVIEKKGAYDAWVAEINKKPFSLPPAPSGTGGADSTAILMKDSMAVLHSPGPSGAAVPPPANGTVTH